MWIHVEWRRRPLTAEQLRGTQIRINCPMCGARNVIGHGYFQDEVTEFIIKRTTSWVQCSACGTALYSRDPATALVGRTPAQLEGVVIWRVSPIKKLLVSAACVLCVWPLVGLVTALAALITTWHIRGRWRRAARIAFGLSILAHVGLLLLFLLVDDSKGVYRR
jgi:ribosomal protein S27E